jgi:hypothetical protein
MDIEEIWWKVVDWINLAQDRDQMRAVVNTALNTTLHKRRGIS